MFVSLCFWLLFLTRIHGGVIHANEQSQITHAVLLACDMTRQSNTVLGIIIQFMDTCASSPNHRAVGYHASRSSDAFELPRSIRIRDKFKRVETRGGHSP